MKNDNINPMHSRENPAFLSSPRCGAKTRKGIPCKAPAVRGKKRCRMHGGAKGSGAPKGNRNAYKHGFCTAEAKNERDFARNLLADLRRT